MNHKQMKKNSLEFFKGFEKCPICGGVMKDHSDAIIKEARDATVLMGCFNCEILIGRFS